MKRILIISLVLMIAMTAFAFASTDVSSGITVQNTSGVTFRASTKVTVIAASDGTTGANGSMFGAVSKHLQGNRQFGTAYNSTAILYNDTAVAVGTAVSTCPGTSIGAFGTGWSSL